VPVDASSGQKRSPTNNRKIIGLLNDQQMIFCLKFISDPNNYSLAGNSTAERSRWLIVVQIKIRLI
jgi:hypothetical protein